MSTEVLRGVRATCNYATYVLCAVMLQGKKKKKKNGVVRFERVSLVQCLIRGSALLPAVRGCSLSTLAVALCEPRRNSLLLAVAESLWLLSHPSRLTQESAQLYTLRVLPPSWINGITITVSCAAPSSDSLSQVRRASRESLIAGCRTHDEKNYNEHRVTFPHSRIKPPTLSRFCGS